MAAPDATIGQQDQDQSDDGWAGSEPPALLHRARGRGALSNHSGRYEAHRHELTDDGWNSLAGDAAHDTPPEIGAQLRTVIGIDASRSIISRNNSPDLGFSRSINPYKGCEHGCIYCYARPTHAWLGLSPGLDFERRIFAKPHAASLLRETLSAPGYRPETIIIGANTDPYQPAEQRLAITRSVLEVMVETRHPVGLITKSELVTRDIDLLSQLAADGLVQVGVSLTSLDPHLSRVMEPRASSPAKRLAAISALSAAGVPVRVMTAPMIPAINDDQLENLLAAGRHMGARHAAYTLLRLPLEISGLFREWLEAHFPDRASRVMTLVRDCHQGKDYDSRFGTRMRGGGPYASLLRQRFRAAVMKLGFETGSTALPGDLFRRPNTAANQLSLEL